VPIERADGPSGDLPAEIDAAGVDREQIRAFLKLTPEERLHRVEEHVESILEIREINAAGGVR
jgi:hypothetical protein